VGGTDDDASSSNAGKSTLEDLFGVNSTDFMFLLICFLYFWFVVLVVAVGHQWATGTGCFKSKKVAVAFIVPFSFFIGSIMSRSDEQLLSRARVGAHLRLRSRLLNGYILLNQTIMHRLFTRYLLIVHRPNYCPPICVTIFNYYTGGSGRRRRRRSHSRNPGLARSVSGRSGQNRLDV
jgi:hypothetical protein